MRPVPVEYVDIGDRALVRPTTSMGGSLTPRVTPTPYHTVDLVGDAESVATIAYEEVGGPTGRVGTPHRYSHTPSPHRHLYDLTPPSVVDYLPHSSSPFVRNDDLITPAPSGVCAYEPQTTVREYRQM